MNVRQTFAINGQSEDEGSNSRPRRSVTQYTIILDLVPRVGIIEREEWLVIDQETQSIARCHRKEAGPPASGMSRETIQCIRGRSTVHVGGSDKFPESLNTKQGSGRVLGPSMKTLVLLAPGATIVKKWLPLSGRSGPPGPLVNGIPPQQVSARN